MFQKNYLALKIVCDWGNTDAFLKKTGRTGIFNSFLKILESEDWYKPTFFRNCAGKLVSSKGKGVYQIISVYVSRQFNDC